MTAVLEVEAPPEAARAVAEMTDVSDAVLSRLVDAAGDLAGTQVLVVGSASLIRMAQEANAVAVAAIDVDEGPAGVTLHPGPFPAYTFDERYGMVLVPAAFSTVGDPFPAIARACAVAQTGVVAYFPRARRSWLGRSPAASEVSHDARRICELFEMAGATQVEDVKAPGGFIVKARMSG